MTPLIIGFTVVVALVVAVVATAEEVFLRGALYDAVRNALDDRAAIVVGAVAFAALHVPLYGWRVVPLDLAVGLVVGLLALAGAYWQAERTAAFDRQDGTGETLRLVCPLH